jgi:hypothetical protein
VTTRKDRLRKLVIVQEQLKSLHETKRAGHLAAAGAAHEEAVELARSADTQGSFAALFPELYQRRISAALSREQARLVDAQAEAAKVAAATMRGTMVDKTYRAVARKDERDAADRERLDRVILKAP